jgi:hypothetical protein
MRMECGASAGRLRSAPQCILMRDGSDSGVAVIARRERCAGRTGIIIIWHHDDVEDVCEEPARARRKNFAKNHRQTAAQFLIFRSSEENGLTVPGPSDSVSVCP